MATITGYGSKHSHEFKLTVNEISTNIENNTSEVSFSFTIYKASYSWSDWNTITYTIDINGTTYTGTIPSYSAGSTLTIKTGSQTISHNDDGTKSISCSFSVNDATGQSYTCGNASASGVLTLTTIPRASSISCTTANIGENAVITINSASSNFRHNVWAMFGNQAVTVAEGYSGGTFQWTIPESFYAQIPNSKSGIGTMGCATYNGDTLIGEKTITITATTNEEKCRPSISATVVDVNNTTIALTGDNTKLIKYQSNAKVDIVVEAKNSATISTKKINNTTISGTTLTINKIETDTFVATVVDSRGYSNSVILEPTVIPYIPLSINANIKRTQPTTGEVGITFTGNYYNGSLGTTNNSLSVNWKYKESGSSTWINGGNISPNISNNTFNNGNTAISLGKIFDYQKSYDFMLVATDKLATLQPTYIVTQGNPIFNWGKDFVNIFGTLKINEVNILELIFPVGSTYTTPDNTNPSQILGFGTWERLKGKVCIGLDENDTYFNTIGKTGGEKEHTLTISELAGHRHVGIYNSSNSWSSSVNQDSSGATIGYQSTTAPIQGNENTMMTGEAGENQPHNNMPPYEVVGYMWIRKK